MTRVMTTLLAATLCFAVTSALAQTPETEPGDTGKVEATCACEPPAETLYTIDLELLPATSSLYQQLGLPTEEPCKLLGEELEGADESEAPLLELSLELLACPPAVGPVVGDDGKPVPGSEPFWPAYSDQEPACPHADPYNNTLCPQCAPPPPVIVIVEQDCGICTGCNAVSWFTQLLPLVNSLDPKCGLGWLLNVAEIDAEGCTSPNKVAVTLTPTPLSNLLPPVPPPAQAEDTTTGGEGDEEPQTEP